MRGGHFFDDFSEVFVRNAGPSVPSRPAVPSVVRAVHKIFRPEFILKMSKIMKLCKHLLKVDKLYEILIKNVVFYKIYESSYFVLVNMHGFS